MAKHTPGIWRVVEANGGRDVRVRANEGYGTVCRVSACLHREGNARLIAAAPDLLAACKAGLHALKMDADHRTDEIAELKAAISKATGTP